MQRGEPAGLAPPSTGSPQTPSSAWTEPWLPPTLRGLPLQAVGRPKRALFLVT